MATSIGSIVVDITMRDLFTPAIKVLLRRLYFVRLRAFLRECKGRQSSFLTTRKLTLLKDGVA